MRLSSIRSGRYRVIGWRRANGTLNERFLLRFEREPRIRISAH